MKQSAYELFKDHCDAHRPHTELVVWNGLRELHPGQHVTQISTQSCDVIAYAQAGNAQANLDHGSDDYMAERSCAAGQHGSKSAGSLFDVVTFGKYDYIWRGRRYIVYHILLPQNRVNTVPVQYILYPKSAKQFDGHCPDTDELILAAARWGKELHNEVYVFDRHWMKNAELWDAVQKASWDDVILDPKMKKALANDVEGFFDRKGLYGEFGVPWKRGVLFHGIPGNGKTMSLKAIMRTVSARPDPIPSLYVKALETGRRDQYAIRTIFEHARKMSPCLLVFEDLDGLVTDNIRSYFLNQVDGLESMDGILMIGSTNHLEKLDPAITKRPSRFDRKYHFSLPGEAERVAYCEHWKKKLADNPSIDFPSELSPFIAKITNGFSFAYLKELFISSLLLIVGAQDPDDNDQAPQEAPVKETKATGHMSEREQAAKQFATPLGKVMLSQVKALRDEMVALGQTVTGEWVQIDAIVNPNPGTWSAEDFLGN